MAADIITKEQIKDYNKIPNKGPTVAKRRSGYLFEEAGICNYKEAWYNGGSKSDHIKRWSISAHLFPKIGLRYPTGSYYSAK